MEREIEMTGIEIHDLPVKAEELAGRLRSALEESGRTELRDLAVQVVISDRPKPHLVFTGQFSSGKSTLINALTDGQAALAVGVAPTTDDVSEPIDWDGHVLLIDTPGVQAGIKDHDVKAERAIAASDLVLFTITTELFDDAGAAHLRHVAFDLSKLDQMLVVITKAGTFTAPDGHRESVVREILGSGGESVRVVECDAQDYLDGMAHRDPVRGQAYRAQSGIDALRQAINALSAARGLVAGLRQPFQTFKSVAAEARSHLVEDPVEQSALLILARQRNALSARRGRIQSLLVTQASTFESTAVRAGEAFANAIEALDEVPEGPARDVDLNAAVNDLQEALTKALDRLTSGLASEMERQLSDLQSELKEIEASPHARVFIAMDLEEMAAGNVAGADGPSVTIPPIKEDTYRRPVWLDQLLDAMARLNPGGFATSPGDAAGGWLHNMVLDIGHDVGVKFKPWGAAKLASRIGKVAKVASVAIPLAVSAAEVTIQERIRLQVERARAKRRGEIVNGVAGQAQDISSEVMRRVESDVDAAFREQFRSIDAAQASIRSGQAFRGALDERLREIEDECTHVLLEATSDEGAATGTG